MAQDIFDNINTKISLINTEYILLSPTKKDIPEIKTLSYYFWEDEGIFSENFYDTILSQKLSLIYKNKKSNIIIAICLANYEKEENEVNISLLCVKKEYQRKGFGKLILNSCIDNCIKKGYYHFYLHVAVTNKKAIKLYEKVGFKKCELIKNYYSEDKPPNNDAFLMKLKKNKKEEKIIIKDYSRFCSVQFGEDNQKNNKNYYNNNYNMSSSKYIFLIIVTIFIIGLLIYFIEKFL